MRKPVARPTGGKKPAPTPKPTQPGTGTNSRVPRAFAPEQAKPDPIAPQNWDDDKNLPAISPAPSPKRRNWPFRLVMGAASVLVSLGLGLALERLISDLFARYDWLGWLGTATLGLLVVGVVVLAVRELIALRRLGNLDALRHQAEEVLDTNLPAEANAVVARLQRLYHHRPDLARASAQLDKESTGQFDGATIIHSAERCLMTPLDRRARALTSASARRVAIVTAISPRAVVDIAFVLYESGKLARAIATLYGARPGLFGGWRLAKAILGHLAVTGGVALGDSVIQQLLGHGLAARLSARLGEGLVNGLMTVRVGIAAMGVTRPLPFDRLKQPQVIDFAADLARINQSGGQKNDKE